MTAHYIPSDIIDFHVHLFPDRMFDAIWEYFSKCYKWDVIYRMYYRECISYLRERGVQKIVFSNYAHREGVAEALNAWNLEILEGIPELYCFAAYHPGDENGLAMADRVLSHPRVLGFKLQLLVQRFFPHDNRLFPMYEKVMERGKRILFHVGTGPVGNEFVGLAEFNKLLDRYPDIPANVAHMGAMEYRGFMDLLEDHPALYLDTAFAFFREFQGRGGFNLGNEELEKHKDRILYGSDFPNLIMPRESEIATLSDYGLSPEFYERVFYRNARELIDSIVNR
ncbi:MAG TPA: amidohydrolase family protein [Spirochaetota bacterium]|nr:amidohydrolase family protein [Spirochaetota bacterium]HPC42810.1 amidohydrolase family protein [Spirochaetota bacterium]HPL19189.1 amidohydrolase family protein [Spirochaetota bacterium]HQF08987.1 amidohydrolase family protein [Spirochaetota bacterium]HQH97875.1 amidohydrolase family protein [Spirochaetota bacterium]